MKLFLMGLQQNYYKKQLYKTNCNATCNHTSNSSSTSCMLQNMQYRPN